MSIKPALSELGEGLISLVFPRLCLNCRRPVRSHQRPQLCITCSGKLAYTHSWETPENMVTDRLAGRLPIVFGAALLTFKTEGVAQALIHALKYYNRSEVGLQLGEQLGAYLKEQPALQDLTGIVPVPLHPKRRHERGYNQAEIIAQGIRQQLNLSRFDDALKRPVFKGSQTRRSRYERVDNARISFAAGKGDFANQHLLLVDDVLTTGSTLDFCGNVLLDAHPGLRLSVATLAVTESN